MIIFKTASDTSDYLQTMALKGRHCGFVPTMGALHAGHLSLIAEARKNNDLVASSIFVNPTQFNNQQDFQLYPVTIEKDIEQLVSAGCDVLLLPTAAEIYPPGHQKKQYPLGEIETILEGAFRPGHFQGVCEVVDRLLAIVNPTDLYLGQKDFQQCMVLNKLLSITGRNNDIRLHVVPTMREADGLAMSSRNLRLTPEDRKKATAIFRSLGYIDKNFRKEENTVLEKNAADQLTARGFSVDYVAIRDRETLGMPSGEKNAAVALVAASLSNIRLIDNFLLD